MASYLIKNALVAGAADETVQDVLIQGETIAEVGRELKPPAGVPCEIIDGTGRILIPGGVDVHTHLNLDVGIAVASDDFYTGTVAAAFGGTTTIVDHPGFGPAHCPLGHQIEKYHGLARGKAIIDYGFHGVIQHVDDDMLRDMQVLAEQGITSFKIYLTYDYKIEDEDALRILRRAKELGVLIAVHPENHGVIQALRARFKREGKTTPHYHPRSRPAECEAEAINRIILWAHLAGDAPVYIVHLTCALGLDFIKAARERGQQRVFAETCPQYLFLDERLYDAPDNEGLKYIMCPPLRGEADRAMLWNGLAKDIDIVATDHCPFFFATQKSAGKDDFTKCPSGAPGIEERIPLMFSEGVLKKRLSLRRFVELCSTNPAKLCGLYPQKGVIQKASDADLVLLNPEERRVLRSVNLHANVDYSAYEGMEVHGYPEMVFSRGEIIVREGKLHAAAGRGRFIKRGASSL